MVLILSTTPNSIPNDLVYGIICPIILKYIVSGRMVLAQGLGTSKNHINLPTARINLWPLKISTYQVYEVYDIYVFPPYLVSVSSLVGTTVRNSESPQSGC